MTVCTNDLLLAVPLDYETMTEPLSVMVTVHDKGDLELKQLFTFRITNENEPPRVSGLKQLYLVTAVLDRFHCTSISNHSKFDENDRKFYKRVENTVGKGEIAHYEQFLLFPWCFQKICIADT